MNALIIFLSVTAVATFCCADRNLFSIDVLNKLKRQIQNPGGSFQAGGSPSSASNQQPSLFVQPGTFTDPSFSSSSQSSSSSTNTSSPSGSSSGASSPFMPSFLDPSKFLSTGQLSPVFAGTGSGTAGSGGYPPGTSGSGPLLAWTSGSGMLPPGTSGSGGMFPLAATGAQGNSTSTGTNSTSGIQQNMYPNMFMNPNQFVG